MQFFTFLKNGIELSVQLPAPDTELVPGVNWGTPCALFTPAYWYAQYLMRGAANTTSGEHRIGQTFAEEMTACILGGYGIPAEIGLAAFCRLREESLISDLCTDQQLLERRLQAPLCVMGRSVKYRFWRQKAKYLSVAYSAIKTQEFPTDDALMLRTKLMALPGVGPKTASWIVRNWLGSDQVAILDVHVVRAGLLMNLFSPQDDVRKNYPCMEAKFITFSRALGVPTSGLDALIWKMMRTTPKLVRRLLNRTAVAAQARSSTPATPIQSPGP
jgi:thermostable 8-oxoguanine DNA glycosylase